MEKQTIELQAFKDTLAELRGEFERKKRALEKEFALSNNPYKMGDIFEDHIGRIKIEAFGTHIDYEGFPTCIYQGVELKKDGTPTKKGLKRRAYQINDINKKVIN